MTFPTNFPLPPTAGQGFTITGINANDQLGQSVASAGDVNNDGIADLIVGAYGFSGGADNGAAYIIFGSGVLNASATFALPPTAGTGFTITGINSGDVLGYSVASAGDVNNDGIADLVVGAYGFSANADNGAAYIIFGSRALSASATFALPPTAGQGFTITGINANDHLGWSVASAGDVNHDGITDLIVGAPQLTSTLTHGATYIIFGSRALSANSTTLDMPPTIGTGFTITGINARDQLGFAVASAGDVNHDGITDLVVGAPGFSSGTSNGAAYVIFGGSTLNTSVTFGLPPTVGNGFAITGIHAQDTVGWSVASAGDVNDDGIADLVVGAQGFSGGALNGAAYIIFGSSSLSASANFALPPIAGYGFTITGIQTDRLGYSVASAGDVNNDGIADLIVGAYGFSGAIGAAYIIFGSSLLSSSATFALPPTAGKGFTITGIHAGDCLGISVASAGDVNNDGIADLVVGAWLRSNGTQKGAAYIIFGYPSTRTPTLTRTHTMTHTHTSTLPYCRDASFTFNVSSVGEMNFARYANTPNIKLYSLPTSGNLLYGNASATIGGTYNSSALQYQAGVDATNALFNYVAISQLEESAKCTANITVTPTCSTASFKVPTGATTWLDFTKYIIGGSNIKLYSLPTSGLLLYGNTLAEAGQIYGANTLQYQATKAAGSASFSYSTITADQSEESSQCSTELDVNNPAAPFYEQAYGIATIAVGGAILAGAAIGLTAYSKVKGVWCFAHHHEDALLGCVNPGYDAAGEAA